MPSKAFGVNRHSLGPRSAGRRHSPKLEALDLTEIVDMYHTAGCKAHAPTISSEKHALQRV